MSLPFNIDGVFHINLDSRTDRRKEVEEELNGIGIPFERFPAIKGNPGLVGCGYSHMEVLKIARSRGYRAVLIFEDDFQFLVSKEKFWALLDAAKEEVPSYDVIMLGYNIQSAVPFSQHFQKVLEAQTASAYVVSAKFYDTLINCYEYAMPLLQSSGRHWDYANDQIWKKFQPGANWYAFKERIGKQRASYSDNAENFVDYGV